MSGKGSRVLDVDHIEVRYGRTRAVSDVTFSVEEGSLCALLGANGAGKTTTLRAISGLLPLAKGSISFAGAPTAGLAPHTIARRGISHVPEGRGLLPTISVGENLKIGLLGTRQDSQSFETAFTYFPQLRGRLDQPAGLLSGGEQQMLSIARAILKKPRLLMVDEMSLGLAPKLIEQLMEVMVELTRSGLSVLCVEQNTRLILRYASHGYVLETGRTIIDGPAAELAADPRIVEAYLGKARGAGKS
jgi:branched-chain amino acid transport system ATP-binding protein